MGMPRGGLLMSQSLVKTLQSHADDVLARIAHEEQKAADAAQRKAAGHQRTADAARKELKRRKRDR